MAITPSFTPHWLQVMSDDTHLSARREYPTPREAEEVWTQDKRVALTAKMVDADQL